MRGLRLRAKLALVALVLLALPFAGYLYVREMERALLAAQEQALAGTARAVATALHERPHLLAYRPAGESALRREAEHELQRLSGSPPTEPPAAGGEAESAEIAAILKGVERSRSRIWVVSRDLRVLALAGSLHAAEGEAPEVLERALGWLLGAPSEQFDEPLADATLAAGREIAAALQGAALTRTRRTAEARVLVVSAAHPIWAGDQVHGAVVVEETTNRIAALRNRALAQLLGVTLAMFLLVALVLLWFASRISGRIRRLAADAEAAIDARGRVTRLLEGSESGDEIGDLSRSFTTVLARLARYNAYLEGMAGRLAHELRTPIAVVRSSLENLHGVQAPEDVRRYVTRAEEGLARLATILARMSEASRLEQALAEAERERYDAVPVVRGCVEGYRLAYARATLELSLPGEPLWLEGAPDLLAQLLDKLVENAVDFSAAGTPIHISLSAAGELRVANEGPALPEEIRESLFDSLVSLRRERGDGVPHLGLGLYVARLIAEYHGGSLRAQNIPGGVALTAQLRAA